MAMRSNATADREFDKFVESPTRPGSTAIEVIIVGGSSGGSGSSLLTKSGLKVSGDFSGSPQKCTVTFAAPFTSTAYSIHIDGVDGRDFTYESKTAAGFVINTNAATALTGEVSWQAIAVGES